MLKGPHHLTENNRDTDYRYWHLIGIMTLSLRFVQGWIYWGGGSRRFIYAPQKLDPTSANYMAHKLQMAMPGALFDLSPIISFLLEHWYLLFITILFFSLIELLCGAFLILGFFTRATALISVFLSISLMILFGWQGSTCMDEWTMAVSNCAMGLTLVLTGASAYSLDSFLIAKNPHLQVKHWFHLIGSGPLDLKKLKWTGLLFFLFCFIFTISTYNYYRGAIFSDYHAGPVNPRMHHVLVKDPSYDNGFIRFQAYVASGDPGSPTYIMKIALLNTHGTIIRVWSGVNLLNWPKNNIKNTYLYNKISAGKFSLNGNLGAKATLTLPEKILLDRGRYTITVETIDGFKDAASFQVS